ncbi:VacJ family lipoprotein [Pseudoduganella eburnea]|uniref:VacJ family lipoprotein n=1 Tax=Massilia eburnea TaxID=1776165 RepID=A0A6L6QCN4_9BURK|nr:VacJ family lipoprotein [Massilia eburnea]MTW09919.1 VacJ family lipoprotein [Massilia eburnea]
MKTTISILLLMCALLGGCATGPNATQEDPLEPYNRTMFQVNDKLDTYVMKPVAKGYQEATPSFLRTGVTNFFSNLGDVGNTINNLLQGKVGDGMESLMRVALNTTFGLAGVLDIATPAGIPKHSQDFGLTLGTWGVPSGPYLVLPLFGPSSIRDGVGTGVDFYADPLSYADADYRVPLRALQVVNTRANYLGASDLLEQAALDKYSFVRDAYLQQRRNRLGQDKDGLPQYEEPEEGKPAEAVPAATPVPPPSRPPSS